MSSWLMPLAIAAFTSACTGAKQLRLVQHVLARADIAMARQEQVDVHRRDLLEQRNPAVDRGRERHVRPVLARERTAGVKRPRMWKVHQGVARILSRAEVDDLHGAPA